MKKSMQFKPLIFLLALAACAGAPRGPIVVSGPEISKPVTAPALDRDGARAAVRSFLQVIDTVEPVAEATCREQAPTANCDFRIVVDDRPGVPPNAFQTLDRTGRPIVAFTIPLIAEVRNQDEMAFILSHEAAHHILGHLARQRQNATLGAEVFGQLAGVIGGSNPDAVQAAQEFGAAIGARSYSKDFELEADRLGTVIAARSGYDPLVGAEFFFRIPDPGNRFLGTHPANAERVAVVRRTAASLGLR
jgi:predicted Zn-dependent protease